MDGTRMSNKLRSLVTLRAESLSALAQIDAMLDAMRPDASPLEREIIDGIHARNHAEWERNSEAAESDANTQRVLEAALKQFSTPMSDEDARQAALTIVAGRNVR